MTGDYVIRHDTPTVDTYRFLRTMTGMGAKSVEAVTRGLPNTLFAVQVFHGDTPVAMGRVVGDGGCFFQVTDIAVLPDHQGRGLGKRVMVEIMAWLREHVRAGGYVSLIADGRANELYRQFGFQPTAPASIGMWWMPAETPPPSR